MNVYDFDNTIYDGESAVDFFMFCLGKDIKLIKLLPLLVVKMVKYKLCLISVEELERYVLRYAKKLIEDFDDMDLILDQFWQKHFHKIKPFYLKQKKEDDIILTATFEFLIKIPVEKLGIKNVIASQIDMQTGEFKRICFRQNKVSLLKEHIDNTDNICFYTDSMNDKPVIDLAKEAYLVKGNKIKRLK